MYLFVCVLLLSHLISFLLASTSLQWNVNFRRNLRITNGTLVPANDSSLIFIKIQDNADYSSPIQYQSVLQLVQPLLTLRSHTPSQSHSVISRILPPLCITTAASIDCDLSPDAHSISRLCDTHRRRHSGITAPFSPFCREGSSLEWVWVADLPQTHMHSSTAIAVIESNTFGIDVPIVRLQLLLFPMSTLAVRSAVPLQLIPFSLPTAAAGSFYRSHVLTGNSVILLNGDIVIKQQDETYSFDWNSTELIPIGGCDTVSSVQVFANGLLVTSKYGLLWIEREGHLNYTAYREPGDTHCPQYLLLEEREPFQFNIYSLDTEQGDIQLMGPEGTFEPILTSDLFIEMSKYFHSDISDNITDNITVLSYLSCWVTQEIILLLSDSGQTVYLITFDTVGNRASGRYQFPPYPPSLSENDTATLLPLSPTNPDTNHTLRIRDMKVLSNTEILLWGTSLLYSPDSGRSFYLFSQITDAISEVDVLPSGRFIVITQQRQVWYGSAGNLHLQQLELEIPDNATCLYQLINENIVEFTFLLANNKPQTSHHRLTSLYTPYSSSNCSSYLNSTAHTVLNSSRPLLSPEAWLTGLTSRPLSNSCPYWSLSLLSSHCISLTRDMHQFISSLPDLPEFDPASFTPSSSLSCSQLGDGLPEHIYLDKSYLFNVSIFIDLSSYFPCINQSDGVRDDLPRVSVWLSSAAVETHTQTLYHPLTHRLEYLVTIRANQSLNVSKLQNGDHFAKTEIKFKVPLQTADCSALELGISSTMFIGCPSKLSIIYDRESSENDQIWIKPAICEEHTNMSCLFFDFGFIPRFYILDELHNIRVPFEGYYNLKPLAAGLSLDRMVNFTNVTNPLGLWAVKDLTESPIQLHTQLAAGIQWMCLHGSFCADIRPSSEYGIPVYYLTLDFSNSLDIANTSFCNLSTQFTVLIYGIPLGPMGTVVSFSVSLLFYLLILVAGYPIYLCRKKIQLFYKTHVYNNVYSAVESTLTSFTRLRMDFHLRKRSNRVEAS